MGTAVAVIAIYVFQHAIPLAKFWQLFFLGFDVHLDLYSLVFTKGLLFSSKLKMT